MDVTVNKILLINNKKYLITWNYPTLDGMYIYLINIDNYSDIIFAKLVSSNEIEPINDEEKLAFIISEMCQEIYIYVL